MININTITYRGIVCIDTFPLELVWGKPHTVLECNNCLAYATFKNVLVGLCKNCALYSYNGKYGNGFYNYPYSNVSNDVLSYCFGAIHPLHIINIKGLEYPQIALNSNETHSIYNLSLSTKYELNLLLQKPFNIYGLSEFQHYYNCDMEVLHMIIEKIKEHKLTFDIWSSNYYTECLTIEKFYKVSDEQDLGNPVRKDEKDLENPVRKDNDNDDNDVNKFKYQCYYCNKYKIKKELKKCSACYDARYCSIACQTRDWTTKHKKICKQEQDLENPAHKSSYDSDDSDDSDDSEQEQEQDLENPARKYSDDKKYDENYDDYDYEN